MLDYDTMEWTNNLKKMLSEIEIWSQLNGHKNICQLFEVYESEGREKVFLRTELGEYGTLASFDSKTRLYTLNPEIHNFAKEKKYSEIQMTGYIFKQLVDAISFMHSKEICHRDIKLANVVLGRRENELVPLYIDFNSAKKIEEGENFSNTEGTLNYNSPESVFGTEEGYCGKKADVWALGVLFYAYVYEELPYDIKDPANQYNYEMELNMAIKDKEPEFKKIADCYNPLIDLIKKMLIKDPNQRPSIEEVLKH